MSILWWSVQKQKAAGMRGLSKTFWMRESGLSSAARTHPAVCNAASKRVIEFRLHAQIVVPARRQVNPRI
jgi:hypothetical protein